MSLELDPGTAEAVALTMVSVVAFGAAALPLPYR